MTPRRALAPALALASTLLAGCIAVQGGARVGPAFRAKSTELAWAGHFAVIAGERLQAGFEFEGRAEHERGSLFTAGLLAGLSTQRPESPVHFAGHADLGVPVAWGSPAGFYAGATLELPIRLTAPQPVADRNRYYRVLSTHPLLVPFARYRFYRLREDGANRHERMHDVAGGAALRVLFETDLL